MNNIKQYYKELGKLVYSVAMADGAIQEEERMELHKFVSKEMAANEKTIDSSGMNQAFYVDFEFDFSEENHLDTTAAINSFNGFIHRNAEKGDAEILLRSLHLIENVSKAYLKNKEKNIVDFIKNKIDEISE